MTTDLPVVVGIDGSQSSERALDWAADEAERRSVPLVIAHAGDVARQGPLSNATVRIVRDELCNFGRELLDDAVATLAERSPKVRVCAVLRESGAADLLIELSHEASVVVVGRGSHSAFGRLVTGSVARHVADRADAPVAIVGDEPPPSRGPIVVGISPSQHGMQALELGCTEAVLHGTDVVALRSWPDFVWVTAGMAFPTSMSLSAVEDAQRTIVTTAVHAARQAHPGLHIDGRLSSAPPETALTTVESAQLLVIGRRRDSAAHLSPLGPIGAWLIQHAPYPVLVAGNTPAQVADTTMTRVAAGARL